MLRPGLRGYEQARHVGNVHGGHLEVVRPQPACAREAVDRVMGDLPVQVERLEQRGQVRLDPGDRSRRKVRLGPEVAPHVVGRDLRDVEVTREPLGELVVGALVGADRALREAAAVAVAEEVVCRRSKVSTVRMMTSGSRLSRTTVAGSLMDASRRSRHGERGPHRPRR